MPLLKTHYAVHEFGSPEAKEQWKLVVLIPDKVKFCDGLMLKKDREYNFTKKTDDVDCEKCKKKMDTWAINRFDLPY